MTREYHRWYSTRLHRDMELLVFGHAGPRAVVFPTRTGRFYDYENWGLVSALQPKLERGQLQLYCVDSADGQGLYCAGIPPAERIRRHELYESYVLEEVLPLTRRNPHPLLIAHGCSIGAYHAVNIALRHPQRFGKAVGLSGRYNLTQEAGPFRDLFDGYYDETIYFHTPCHFMANLRDEAILRSMRRMDIVLAVGQDDLFCPNNVVLSEALRRVGVPHRLELWPGEAHRARHWREMVKKYL